MRPFVQHYDLIYGDKDYAGDIDAFESLLGAPLSHMRVLEIGAGTGSQSLLLAPRASGLTAVELDEEYAQLLRARLRGVANVEIHSGPVETLAETGYDVGAAFFHVLNYLEDEAQLASFLSAVAMRLKPGALFIADIWHGDAVRLDPPRKETREKVIAGVHVVQEIAPTLSADSRNVDLHYEITLERADAQPIRFTEMLRLRLWLDADLTGAFSAAGFRDVEFFDVRAFPAPATSRSWRVWLRARRT